MDPTCCTFRFHMFGDGSTTDPLLLYMCRGGSSTDPLVLSMFRDGSKSTTDPLVLNMFRDGSTTDPLSIEHVQGWALHRPLTFYFQHCKLTKVDPPLILLINMCRGGSTTDSS
jgi:hypothetical protein